MSDITYVTGRNLKFLEQSDPFQKLPELAERLGVRPNAGNGGTMLRMKNGDTYDLFDLMKAFLDKVDGITSNTASPPQSVPTNTLG